MDIPGVRQVWALLSLLHVATGTSTFPYSLKRSPCQAGESVQIHAEPPYTMCLHPAGELISDSIRAHGQWNDCQHYPAMALHGIWSDISRKVKASFSHGVDEKFISALGPFLGGVVLDVGANIGSCAFKLASLGHQVFAFEPVTSNVQLMKATKKANDLKGNVHIFHGLISSDSREDVSVMANTDSHNMGAQIVRPGDASTAADGPANFHMSIPAIKLDDVIHGHVHFMKMDCQGCEYNAIFGAENLFKQHGVDVLYFEYGPWYLQQVTDKAEAHQEILLKLIDYGMTLWWRGANHVPGQNFNRMISHADVLKFINEAPWEHFGSNPQGKFMDIWGFPKETSFPIGLKEILDPIIPISGQSRALKL